MTIAARMTHRLLPGAPTTAVPSQPNHSIAVSAGCFGGGEGGQRVCGGQEEVRELVVVVLLVNVARYIQGGGRSCFLLFARTDITGSQASLEHNRNIE